MKRTVHFNFIYMFVHSFRFVSFFLFLIRFVFFLVDSITSFIHNSQCVQCTYCLCLCMFCIAFPDRTQSTKSIDINVYRQIYSKVYNNLIYVMCEWFGLYVYFDGVMYPVLISFTADDINLIVKMGKT